MNNYDMFVTQNVRPVVRNEYVYPVLIAFLAMYPALIRPKLPTYIEKLFENPIFRLVLISYILYKSKRDMKMAIMIASVFLITMHMINKRKVDKFANTIKVKKADK